MALAGISSDSKYWDAIVRMGESNQWRLGPRKYQADHGVGQTNAELYFRYREPKMSGAMQAQLNHILVNPRSFPTLDFAQPAIGDL